jgi:signal transduction histidine kinase
LTTNSEHKLVMQPWPSSVLWRAIGQGDSDLMAPDFESFRRQELLFAVLNQILIGALLVLHIFSRFVHGRPAASVIVVLTAGFVVESMHVAWLLYRRTAPAPAPTRRALTLWSLGFNSALALLLTSLTMGGDTAYYALLLLPVLEAAFRLGFGGLIAILMLANFISFLGAYGLKFGEYIEAGAMSVIYTVMGILVWLLVNNLRERENKSAHNVEELERTRHQLLSEEKLAAVGLLSRALAHEIRNPVAMISSSLATAIRAGQNESERAEMFAIAAKEGARLELLTTDFLVYARPRAPQIARVDLSDLLNYTAVVARAHAATKGVAIDVAAQTDLEADLDPAQI